MGIEDGRIKGGMTEEHRGTSGDGGYVYYFNCGKGFMVVNICPNSSNFAVVKKWRGNKNRIPWTNFDMNPFDAYRVPLLRT